IFSVDAAEAYLKTLSERREGYLAFANALDIRDRGFSESEKRYVDAWRTMGFTPEAAALAYDRTLVQTGKRSWGYMNSILKRWHAAGLHDPEEIEKKDTYQKPERGKAQPGAKPGETPVTQEYLDRLQRKIVELGGGNP
ncbi:MAG: DnaD domain protein, partial [bacterium]